MLVVHREGKKQLTRKTFSEVYRLRFLRPPLPHRFADHSSSRVDQRYMVTATLPSRNAPLNLYFSLAEMSPAFCCLKWALRVFLGLSVLSSPALVKNKFVIEEIKKRISDELMHFMLSHNDIDRARISDDNSYALKRHMRLWTSRIQHRIGGMARA